jgi:S-(hydroxymethyl)glutathione dehydrogenase / alcohol dehydrogenase
MSFRAAVLRNIASPLSIEQLCARSLEPDEVLVRMHAAGVCHTDYEAMTGSFSTALPVVLGHEGAGVVEAIGSGVYGLSTGDHVVCSIYPSCGGCYYCRRTLPMLCERLPSVAKAASRPALLAGDSAVNTFLNVSSFAEYCIVQYRGAIRVSPEIPFECACLLGCAVITGVGGVLRVAQVQMGESVAVVGCGAVGLNVLQGARIAGAEVIIAVDRSTAKLKRAAEFGATHTFLADEEDLTDRIRKLTQGRGVDHGFEAAGIVGSLQATLDYTRPGATVTILGKTSPHREISLRFGSMMGERHILRSSLGGARAADDFPAYARAYLGGRLKLDEQIDLRLPLESINDAFDEIDRGEVIRSVILMNQ